MEINKIYQGDCINVMQTFPSESIDMCMTSPPYWGLRDYGVDGQYGIEESPEEYIEKMTGVFSEVKRVLKKEGTIWLNIGDTYASTPPGNPGQGKKGASFEQRQDTSKCGLPQKCLCMIPERLAWSLIQDGWILRNKIIWYKPNGMPSSVKDRFSNKWEYVFMFSKQQKYYFDLDAVREEYVRLWDESLGGNLSSGTHKKSGKMVTQDRKLPLPNELGKNPGDVFKIPSETRTMGAIIGTGGGVKVPGGKGWTGHPEGGGNACQKDPRWSPPNGPNPGDFFMIPTCPMPEAHFAVFPEKLCEKPIKAGCPEGGIVLDPFSGAGTTAYVAKEMGRKYIGIELNPEYIKIAERRLAQQVFNFNE